MTRVALLAFVCCTNLVKVEGFQERRLVIEGPYPDTSLAPYAVAIVACYVSQSSIQGSDYTKYCSSFCSGTLIAPDVVLTAGHCTHAADSPFGTSQPLYTLADTYVIVGSADLAMTDGKLVGVTSVSNAGFASSKAYPIDNDVGLVFLNECVAEVPGVIEYAKVATLDTEPNSSCQKISAMGFGVSTNIPSALQSPTSKLRYTSDVLHDYSICAASYARILMQLRGYPDDILDNPLYSSAKDFYYSQVVPEMNMCSGGNSPVYAICRGDSGGGVFDSNSLGSNSPAQVLGVNSFGIAGSDSDNFCGWGSDYSSRVAFHGTWIRDTVANNSMNCSGWNIQSVFASWPVPEMEPSEYSDVYKSTRCIGASEWQCASGPCIPLSSVCDKVNDCGSGDNSDEDANFCYVAYLTRVKSQIKIEKLETSAADIKIKYDLQNQVEEFLAGQESPPTGTPSYVIVGTSSFGTINHSPEAPFGIVLPEPSSYSLDIFNTSNLSGGHEQRMLTARYYPALVNVANLECFEIVWYIDQVNNATLAEGLNRPEYEPELWTDMCARYFQCALPVNYTDTLCNAWNAYMANRDLQATISQGFNARFGSSCPVPFMIAAPALPAFSIATTSTTTVSPSNNTTTTTTERASTSSSSETVASDTTTLSCSDSSACTTSKGSAGPTTAASFSKLSVVLILALAHIN